MIENTDAVIFAEQRSANGRKIGFATLNSEKSLNALTLDMIRLLDNRLREWAQDPELAVVVLQGAGEKAFCAGGDVRKLRTALVEGGDTVPNPFATTYFTEEYCLDYLIHTYQKPILLWGSGIVMGGGLGLMAGASHRVVTESSRIAMPEITIGLYPDVGGSWFLNRMPGRVGLFLALTAAPLNAHDALVVNLADFFVCAEDKLALAARLTDVEWSEVAEENHGKLSKLLREFSARAEPLKPASPVRKHFDLIQQLTDGDTLAEVVEQILAHQHDDDWMKRAAKSLAAGSPTSAALSWAIAHRARHLSLAEAFQMELTLSVQCCAHPDFREGVRALLIDKDNTPKWSPATLAEVSAEHVAAHFASPWSAEEHPLAGMACCCKA
ncbi:enoyl-CoA hydratase/isomerase family protein [Aquaspirillum soli]